MLYGISSIIMEMATLGMFKSVKSIDFNSLSKDHIGEVEVNFQDEIIQESVFTNDDANSISERIIKKSSLD